MLNHDGLTEEEFLALYDDSMFKKPSVTVDMLLFCPKTRSLLLIKRGNHPSIGKWALPGGFLEPNETAEEGARRELFEETNVNITAVKQLHVMSNPNRDPRTRIVTVAFLAFADDEYNKFGDDAADSAYFRINKDVLSSDDECEECRIRLYSSKETIKYSYKKIKPQGIYPSDCEYTCEGAERIAGDHWEIIARGIDAAEELLCTKMK